ncbi:hypothetical protein [Bacillus sp. ISL-45]|uniref:hypothetical protein n=1 Tax=Bacillus sp. ISL-45 TaxID=2819128 RepID=UPI001BEB93B9|nr:hypothetical protein [Bacillus sp. ISL-45]MBT2663307.1 hypothetical protein [Bacillus sp. ISL-45]
MVIATFIKGGRDFYLAKEDHPPNFSPLTEVFKDGGTKVYSGISYKVIDYNQLHGRKDVVLLPFYIDDWELK